MQRNTPNQEPRSQRLGSNQALQRGYFLWSGLGGRDLGACPGSPHPQDVSHVLFSLLSPEVPGNWPLPVPQLIYPHSCQHSLPPISASRSHHPGSQTARSGHTNGEHGHLYKETHSKHSAPGPSPGRKRLSSAYQTVGGGEDLSLTCLAALQVLRPAHPLRYTE